MNFWNLKWIKLMVFSGLVLLIGQHHSTKWTLKSSFAFDNPQEIISVDVQLVNVLFTVKDKKGKFVSDITPERVKIYEDGKLQKITSFSKQFDQPLAVALLIDTSSSARATIKVQQEAAIDFFHNTISRKKDKGLLMSFDSTIEVLQDFIDDRDRLTRATKSLRIGGGTKMFDAIQFACQEKLVKEIGMRRILVIIGDGDDNMSYETLDSVIQIAQQSDVSMYTISTNSSGFFGMSEPKQDKILKKLAVATGGNPYSPAKIDDLALSFYKISEELRNQYSVAYRSTNKTRNGAFRKIKIDVKGKKLKLQYRKGYYAIDK